MPTNNLSELTIPNTGLLDWVRSFGKGRRYDYGIEYLSLTAEGRLAPSYKDGPNYGVERYALPQGVCALNLEDTIRQHVEEDTTIPDDRKERLMSKRVDSLLDNYTNKGRAPKSIRTIDLLRENPDSPYHIDLLGHSSYSGEKINIDGVPYSSPFLPQLAYLAASVLGGGCIRNSTKGSNAIIWPSGSISREALEKKLEGCITRNVGAEDVNSEIVLKSHYGRLLNLAGIPRGEIVDLGYEQLGLGLIEQLIGMISEGSLSFRDYEHAIKIVSGFVEGITDHRYREYQYNTEIQLPKFTQKDSSDKFSNLFVRAFKIARPNVSFSTYTKSRIIRETGKTYYYAELYLRR